MRCCAADFVVVAKLTFTCLVMKLYGIGRFITFVRRTCIWAVPVYTVVSSFRKTMAMDIKFPYSLVNNCILDYFLSPLSGWTQLENVREVNAKGLYDINIILPSHLCLSCGHFRVFLTRVSV